MDLAARRELNKGFGDTLARSFEFAVTPVIFAAGGFGLDQILGTTVVFTIVLLIFGLTGVLIRWFYDYERHISHIESERAERLSNVELSAPVINRPMTNMAGLPTGVTLEDPPTAVNSASGRS